MTTTARVAVLLCGAVLVFPAGASGADTATLWTAPGLGEVRDVAVVDGNPIILGGGVGQVTATSLTDGSYGWVDRTAPGGSDWDYLIQADLDADGRDEVVSGGDSTGLVAIDSATGQALWDDDGIHRSATVGDFDGDGSADVAYDTGIDYLADAGRSVQLARGSTGSPIAKYDRNWFISAMGSGDVNLDGVRDVVVVGTEYDRADGDPVGDVELATGTDLSVSVVALTFRGGSARVLWEGQVVLAATMQHPTEVMVANTAPAPGPEVVVGGLRGLTVLSGPTGTRLGHGATAPDEYVTSLDTTQLDLDPYREIVAGTAAATNGYSWEARGAVLGFDGLGVPLWTTVAPRPVKDIETADVSGSKADEIIVSGGGTDYPLYMTEGFVHVLRGTATAAATVWTRPLPSLTRSVTFGRVFGQDTILATQDEGLVALDGAGRERWRFRSGAYRWDLDAGDLDADGTPEVVEASADGFVAVRGADAKVRWAASVPGNNFRRVTAVATGELSSDPGREVVAGSHGGGTLGASLSAYAADGRVLWTTDYPAPGATAACPASTTKDSPATVVLDDIDGDARDDLLTAGSGGGWGSDRCTTVARIDGDGTVVWVTGIDTYGSSFLDVVEINGDGVRDLVLPDGGWASVPGRVVALDGRDGTVLWQYDHPTGSTWIDADQGLIATGGAGGTVSLLRADGTVRWEASASPSPSGQLCTGRGSFSVDADGDGVDDVVVAQRGGAKMLSGADGSVIWSSDLPADACGSRVATLRGGSRPVVAVAVNAAPGLRVEMVDAGTGERLSSRTVGPVNDIVAADLDGDGAEEAVVAAGSNTVVLKSGR